MYYSHKQIQVSLVYSNQIRIYVNIFHTYNKLLFNHNNKSILQP